MTETSTKITLSAMNLGSYSCAYRVAKLKFTCNSVTIKELCLFGHDNFVQKVPEICTAFALILDIAEVFACSAIKMSTNRTFVITQKLVPNVFIVTTEYCSKKEIVTKFSLTNKFAHPL